MSKADQDTVTGSGQSLPEKKGSRSEPDLSSSRLDFELVQRGLASSRAKAREMIQSGMVQVCGKIVTKPSHLVTGNQPLTVTGLLCPYVSRGGLKLEAALDRFGINPQGKVCFDAGASAGGFTDCLLQRGAARVYAVDVGTDQLSPVLKADPRVVSREQVNLRYLTPDFLPERCHLLTADVSFISLTLLFKPLATVLEQGAGCVFLVKPEFEAGRKSVHKGIVKDPSVHRKVLANVVEHALACGYSFRDVMPSPVPGQEGNLEFLLYLSYGIDNTSSGLPEQAVRKAVEEGHTSHEKLKTE